jgi:Rrf2 family iron-sulfur cluster assembly transcriptional regulator
MQLTTKGRYAITAMLDLAVDKTNAPITLTKISERQNISLSYLEQLFTKLRKKNLVKSIRGPGGGYTLNKEIGEISISQIIEAIDENVDLRRCAGKGNCNNGRECISHGLWCEISSQIREFLANKTLSQVIADYENPIKEISK